MTQLRLCNSQFILNWKNLWQYCIYLKLVWVKLTTSWPDVENPGLSRINLLLEKQFKARSVRNVCFRNAKCHIFYYKNNRNQLGYHQGKKVLIKNVSTFEIPNCNCFVKMCSHNFRSYCIVVMLTIQSRRNINPIS